MKDITDKIGIVAMDVQLSCRNPSVLECVTCYRGNIIYFYTAQNSCFEIFSIVRKEVIKSLILTL